MLSMKTLKNIMRLIPHRTWLSLINQLSLWISCLSKSMGMQLSMFRVNRLMEAFIELAEHKVAVDLLKDRLLLIRTTWAKDSHQEQPHLRTLTMTCRCHKETSELRLTHANNKVFTRTWFWLNKSSNLKKKKVSPSWIGLKESTILMWRRKTDIRNWITKRL